jgi:protein gp37
MQKTKIEWVKNPDGSQGYSWNPIRGLCPVGCFYCYARAMYKRFKWDSEIRLDLDELMADFPKKPSRIFVCSTFELFHPLADPYRNNIFKHIGLLPEHTFIILTKMPERINRPMPDNIWLGVTVTGNSLADTRRTEKLAQAKAHIKFISFEPILAEPWLVSLPLRPDWIIAGRLTGHGKSEDPKRSTIEAIVEYGRVNDISIFLKNNLADIWGKPLIQEYPK